MSRIRVYFVEDDPFWQKRLSADLQSEEDLEVIGYASSREEALEAAAGLEFDVVLMDVNLSGHRLDGLEAAKEILAMKGNRCKVIMLTSLDDREIIIKAFMNGALNFINKSSYKDIVTAIRDVHQGKYTIHSDAALEVIREIQLSMLTPAEKEIYNLRRRGLSKSQIAQQLYKSINTIKTQLRSIKNKITDYEETK